MASFDQAIIHVGMPKTGSTAIQQAFDGCRDTLRSVGVSYPSHATRGGAHHPVAWSARQSRIDSPKAPPIDQVLDSLSEELSGRSGSLVVSSEALFHLPTTELRPIAQWTQSLAEHTYIVSYVRAPAGFREGWYRQRIKTSAYTLPFSDHIAQAPPVDTFRTLTKLSRLGMGDLVVRPFLRASFPFGDIVEDFATVAGVPVGALRGRHVSEANVSLDAELTEFKLRMNQIGVEHTPAIERSLRKWSSSRRVPERSLFSREEWSRFNHLESDDHQRVLSTFDLPRELTDARPELFTESEMTSQRFAELLDEFRNRFPELESTIAGQA